MARTGVCRRHDGSVGGHEAAPLVVGNMMFIVTPFPNTLFALDLTHPGSTIKWRYDPDPQGAAKGVACCDTVNRGAAYADGRVFINTLDGFTAAVDAETGRELWKTQLGDINLGETVTMAPMVVKGKVLVGNSGGVIMWVPAGIVLMVFGLALFAAWLGEAERRRQRGWS